MQLTPPSNHIAQPQDGAAAFGGWRRHGLTGGTRMVVVLAAVHYKVSWTEWVVCGWVGLGVGGIDGGGG
jgi:hypothetical protein